VKTEVPGAVLIVLNALDKYREQVARLEQPEPQGDCLAICTGCGGTRTYFDKQNIERCLGCRSEGVHINVMREHDE